MLFCYKINPQIKCKGVEIYVTSIFSGLLYFNLFVHCFYICVVIYVNLLIQYFDICCQKIIHCKNNFANGLYYISHNRDKEDNDMTETELIRHAGDT